MSGRDFQSVVVRPFIEQKLVENIGVRFQIIELEGFLFFGSAAQIVAEVRKVIDNNKQIPSAQRVRYMLIDFKHVTNADNSSIDQFQDIDQLLSGAHIHLIFSGLNTKLKAHFEKRCLIAKPPGKQEESHDPHAPKAIDYHVDVDHAAEYVEELLLARAQNIRELWLVFDSFRKVHTEALIKTSCETFEAVIGSSSVGTTLWKYASLQRVAEGELLCEQGTYHKTLYVLQEGMLTSYVEKENGDHRRLHKMNRGAFINDECLFLDLPVGYNVMANRKSVVWAITQESMRRMERNDPNLALEIVRRVLRHTSTVRMRLEREVHAVSREEISGEKENNKGGANPFKNTSSSPFSSTHNEKNARMASTSRFGSNLGKALEAPHKGGIVEHHSHQFVHLPGQSDLKTLGGKVPDNHVDLSPYRVHLSYHDLEDARRCFVYHARPKESANAGFKHYNNLLNEATEPAAPAGADVNSPSAAAEFMTGAMTNLRDKQNLDDEELEIDLEEIEKVVMDLGMFPTHEELQQMHDVLAFVEGEEGNRVGLEEFLCMVGALKLSNISDKDKEKLYTMYATVAEPGKGLTKEGLETLIGTLGGDAHDEGAFDHIMQDWDVKRSGYIEFDAFLSIFSMFLKAQEKEVQFMNDFKRFCPKFTIETDEDDVLQLVDAQNILDVFFKLDFPMTKEIAEEMVFDADLDSNGAVSYDDLICTISTVGINEVYTAMENEQEGLRVMQEIKRVETMQSHAGENPGRMASNGSATVSEFSADQHKHLLA